MSNNQKSDDSKIISTRDKLLDAAHELFYTKGYNATGLNEILKQAEVHKGSLYHLFSSKKELAIAVIYERIGKQFEQRYMPLAQSNTPLESLLDFISNVDNFDLHRGCPVSKLAQEISTLNDDFKQALSDVYLSYERYIEIGLQHAVEKGELQTCDVHKLAIFIASSLTGAIQRSILTGDEAFFHETIDQLKTWLLLLTNQSN